MGSLQGSDVQDKNFRFRLYAIFFIGIGMFGAVLYWRSQTLLASESIDMPQYEAQRARNREKHFLEVKASGLQEEETPQE